ncbi:MAG: hypothetical protein MUE81_08885 [Thermoflexibacter sp.]|jgi:hypothetical protein|nr:hypothetical protein [Thermoflexibacter sp.]
MEIQENKELDYLVDAVRGLLELIDRTNKIIQFHLKRDEPDMLAVEGYQRRKRKFVAQLVEMLAEHDIDVKEIAISNLRQVA